ncbi:hypothetical protein [Arcobacter porcinus]|uniref:Uncharacterized protein n=2 Tax=Arcobacteraceae TaxID=2808963 RepID=A0A5C2HH32_9BACT|nr:hypothetical protein [Arcobacter porcinus]OCL81827.1 hypothetical protein AAX27_02221 [Aliarcobacter thereius]QEP41434.1 hypothetical protein APORC_1875 [Arcobacter porcinus]
MTKEEMKNYAIKTIENMEDLRDDLARINLSSKLDILNENLRKIIDEKTIDQKEFFYLIEDLRDTIIDFHSYIFSELPN